MAKKFTLLLLYNKISASTPVVHALNAKGMQVIAVDNSADLVSYMKNKEIDLVGLSVNNSHHANVAQILKGKIPFFSFAEDSTELSARKVEASTADIKISGGSASAYSIWMGIGPYVKAQSNPATAGKVTILGREADDSMGVVHVDEEKAEGFGSTMHVADDPTQNIGMASELRVKMLKDSTHRALNRFGAREIHNTKFPPLSKITMMPVLNDGDEGLLLFCGNNNEVLHRPSMEEIRENINREMNNKNFECVDIFEMEIPVDDVCHLALDRCKFAFIYSDKVESLACFFRHGRIFAGITRTENHDMFKIELTGIPLDTPLDFDLFLYFNRNEKLVPFIARGDSLSKDKVDRLQLASVDYLYFKADDKHAVFSMFINIAVTAFLREPVVA